MILKKETQQENGPVTVFECFHVCSDETLRIYNIKSSGYQTEDRKTEPNHRFTEKWIRGYLH